MSKKKSIAKMVNDITFTDYYDWLTMIALNIAKYENIPSSIDIRYLEMSLLRNGSAVWFKDEVANKITALSLSVRQENNKYGIPTLYDAMSIYNSYRMPNLDPNNSVIMYNNYMRTNSLNTIELFAYKLANIDRSIDVNVSGQRTPVMVASSEQQKLTMRNLITDYDGNEPFIFVDNKIDLSGVKVWNTQAPYVGDKLESLLHSRLNDFLSRFGIENANADKKERMVTGEVNANTGLVEINRSIFLTPREEALRRCNEMWGTDMKVSFNSDLMTLVNGYAPNGGELNE
jgi:hypothetical protein